MDPGYAAAYRDLYERHWWWRARETFLLDRLDAGAAGRTDLRILDVGCGDALFFSPLSTYGTVRGVEPDKAVLSEGPWRSMIHAGTLDTFEVKAPFDWILMLDVVEHLEEPAKALRRARELARDDTTLFITVPAFQSLWTRHDDLNHHHARYNRSSLSAVLSAAGWNAVELKYFFHWLVPLKLLVRLKEVVVPGDPDVESVPGEALNTLARAVSLAEQQWLSWLNLPFGTSLYARCRLKAAL
jgi:SAM-dependent methyltransferase